LTQPAQYLVGEKISVRRPHQDPLYNKFIVYRYHDSPNGNGKRRLKKMSPQHI